MGCKNLTKAANISDCKTHISFAISHHNKAKHQIRKNLLNAQKIRKFKH